MDMIDIKEDIQTIQAQIEAFKQKYQKSITGSIHQNPDIHVLNDRPRCFVINSSNLSSDMCLAPEYYDLILQANILMATIKQFSLERISRYLTHIITRGNLPMGTVIRDTDSNKVLYSGTYNFRINPKVVTILRDIMDV